MNLEITLNKFTDANLLMADGIASIFVCVIFCLVVFKTTKAIDDVYLNIFKYWTLVCSAIGIVCGVLKIIAAGA